MSAAKPPPGFDPATLAFYAAEVSVYVNEFPRDPDPRLSGFLAALPAGGTILELGCGGGTDAAFMIASGFSVDATDGVPEMVAEAAKRLGPNVRLMRFDQLDADNAYDGILANASLLHVPIDELSSILARIWRALKPGGWHLASFKTGGGEGIDKHGRYYNRPSEEILDAAYRSAGSWAKYDVQQTYELGNFGEPSDWLTVTAQKA